MENFSAFSAKMKNAGLSESAIKAFRNNYENLLQGKTGLIPEKEIQPVQELPSLEAVARKRSQDPALLAKTVILKLNGGLGTSMGLEKAKSLLEVKKGMTFLDLIVQQILYIRRKHQVPLRFMLMNSFNTSEDSIEFLEKYPELGNPKDLELMQNSVPKVDAETLLPVSWPENPQQEWCPPGHGDLYPSLSGSGWLDRLVAEGITYLFVSNSDNLGATLDLHLLNYFANSDLTLLMEVAERNSADKKGGHLAQSNDGRFLLRESAQCPEEDVGFFQDISRHRFFNTNNLWIRLDHLKAFLESHEGLVPLPMIKNVKTVDPRNKRSPQVYQLETAMGAAIGSFRNTGAIVVPRTRFAPVKATSDLLILRSDAYEVTQDMRISAVADPVPVVDLDADFYKMVDQLDSSCQQGVPSLRHCSRLTIKGPVRLSSAIQFQGTVRLTNPSSECRSVEPGIYRDCEKTV